MAEMSPTDVMLLDRNRGFMDGEGFLTLILFFLLFGGGFGNFGLGNFGANNMISNYATQADIQRGFDINSIDTKLDTINSGLCRNQYETAQLSNATNMNMNSGFNTVTSAIANLGYQNQNCCCETNRNIDAVRYENYKNTCDLIQAGNANTQAILDKMCANEIQQLRDNLQLATQTLANETLAAQIVQAIRPFPQPAYITASPYTSLSNGCGCGMIA